MTLIRLLCTRYAPSTAATGINPTKNHSNSWLADAVTSKPIIILRNPIPTPLPLMKKIAVYPPPLTTLNTVRLNGNLRIVNGM